MQDIEALRNLAFEKLAEGDVKAAYEVISQVIAVGCPTLDDIYLCGQWALDSGYYLEAIKLLTSVICESMKTEDIWYLDCAYIARAYARTLVGQYSLAEEDLSSVDESAEISWMLNHPVINKRFISEAILKQKRPQ